MTVEAWVKTSSSDPDWTIVSKYSHNAGGNLDDSYYLAPGVFQINAGNSYSQVGPKPATIITDGNWHHIVGTWDGTTQNYYVDGQLENSITYSGSGHINITSEPVMIGATKSGGSKCCFMDGLVDELAIYNRALSPTEISDIYNAGSIGKCKNPAPAGFVYTDGTQFMLDGQPFYFGGTNSYILTRTKNLVKPEVVDEVLQSVVDMKLKVIRIWGFNYETIAGLENVIAKAAAKDLKLIVVLTDNWYSSDPDWWTMDRYVAEIESTSGLHDEFYGNSEVVVSFENRVEDIVAKFKNEPAIMAWELANEPRCKGDYLQASVDCSADTITIWANSMASFIKGIDSNHLVAVGDEGFFSNWPGDERLWDGSPDEHYYNDAKPNSNARTADFDALLRLDNIDFGTFHLYPYGPKGPDDGWQRDANWGTNWIRDHIRWAHDDIGKPVILEEFGYVDKVCDASDALCRNTIYETWTRTICEEKGNGFLFWMLGHASQSSGEPGEKDPYWIYYDNAPEDPEENKQVRDTLAAAAETMVDCHLQASEQNLFDKTFQLAPGETISATISIPQNQRTVTFRTDWSGSIVDTIIIDPQGNTITPEVALTKPDIYHIKASTSELYWVSNPSFGIWTVNMFGADIPIAGEDTRLTVRSLPLEASYLPIIIVD